MTNASVEYHEELYRALDADTAASIRTACAELTCSECGSEDGMQGGWTREAIVNIQPMWVCQLYRYKQDDYELYTPCAQCNPWRCIPDGYMALTPIEIVAWCRGEI